MSNQGWGGHSTAVIIKACMLKGGQSIRLCLYISSAFAGARRPPRVAESERATGSFTQECVIIEAGGTRPIRRVRDTGRHGEKDSPAVEGGASCYVCGWSWKVQLSSAVQTPVDPVSATGGVLDFTWWWSDSTLLLPPPVYLLHLHHLISLSSIALMVVALERSCWLAGFLSWAVPGDWTLNLSY